jgi:hypothetical protein
MNVVTRTPVSRRAFVDPSEDNYCAKPEAAHKLLKGMRRRDTQNGRASPISPSRVYQVPGP